MHSQAERPVGYGEWDVVRWAADQQCFYDAACAEWAEAGALHFTGRGTLQDFILVRRIGRYRPAQMEGKRLGPDGFRLE